LRRTAISMVHARSPVRNVESTSMSSTIPTELAPRLIVSAGDDALDFYARAFDTAASDQFYDGGRLLNGYVLIGSTLVGVTEEDGYHNHAPTTIGGTPVILSLTVPNVDEAAARFVEAGGEVVIPIDDRPYGRRDVRLEDPFGHLWIIGRPLN
jgi:PhnB protein